MTSSMTADNFSVHRTGSKIDPAQEPKIHCPVPVTNQFSDHGNLDRKLKYSQRRSLKQIVLDQ